MLLLGSIGAVAQIPVNFTIDAKKNRKAISPLIYGTNDNYPHARAKRLGGNRITNYNWENNASNAGRDWYNESDNYVPWQQGVPEDRYNEPGAALKFFQETSVRQGAYSLVTLPMAKYVTADKNGRVDSAQIAPSSRWNSIVYRKPGPFSLTPNLNDKTVYTDEEINFLIANFGKSNTATGVKGYALDNEPGIWFDSHPRLWGPEHTPVKYLMDRSFELAGRIKEMDPTAEVFGPASWGVAEFETLQFAPDWDEVNQGKYPTFLNYYLAKMKEKAADPQVGKRLLDVLDVHWYPQGRNDGVSPFNNSTDYATNAARMEMTRSLWDSTYVEDTWIGQDGWKREQFLPFIPKMKSQINTYYPGTKLAITEYSYMGYGHPSGGIAQADALGIFGKQGLYLATYWGGVDGYIRSGFDAYLNYDGKGGKFGDISISSETSDITNSSVHASVESADESRTHLIAMNKNQDQTIVARVKVNSDRHFRSARVWAFDGKGTTMRQLKNIRVITNNEFEYTIPALTVCHILLTEEDLSIYPDFETATVYPAAGYSDGTASFDINATVTDGDNNISSVTADLSGVGGPVKAVLQLKDAASHLYTLHYTVPDGATSGLKDIKLTAVDATNRTTESTVNYRVIKKTSSTLIWDGDAIAKGRGDRFYDSEDRQAATMKIEKRTSGGNVAPGSLYMHFIHEASKYSVMTFRLSENDNPVDARDLSDYGYIEFYLKSNAPSTSDIEFSIRDASAQLNTSNTVFLKAGGYVSSFNPDGYTRVKIPVSDLTLGSEIRMDQVWQFNFSVNTASKGFDVWVDDIRALPYSHPYKEPVISSFSLSRNSGYADGVTKVTLNADVGDPDGDLKEVSLDLSELKGPNRQVMTGSGGKFSYTYTIPQGVSHGPKKITLTASDAAENASDKNVTYKIEEVAGKLVLWDGDTKNTGKHIETNKNTVATVESTGGNEGPISMNVHMDQMDNGFAAATWDWNEGTENAALMDLSAKRYLEFYIKVTPPSAHFDMQVYMKDANIQSTPSLSLKGGGYISSYTGQYQLVRIPLKDLFTNKDMNTTQMTRFGLLSNQLGATKLDFRLDDITATGSSVADVRLETTDAQCGNTGKITVASISEPAGPFNYYINGTVNPAGAGNASFSGLAPGKYTIRITGMNDFVYMEEVTLKALACTGKTEVKVTDAACGANGVISVVNLPSGLKNTRCYLNNVINPAGASDPVFRNLKPGSYTLKITADGGYVFQQKVKVGGTASAPVIKATIRGHNIDLKVTGGSGIYIYKWSDGSETQNLWEVPDGTYSVVVTDAATGCASSFTGVVFNPYAEVATTDAACAANGRIVVSNINARTQANYYINGKANPSGLNHPEFSNLKPGTYTIKVLADQGFNWSQKVTVGGTASPPVVRAIAADGAISLVISGGSGVYIYQWSEGSTTRDLYDVPPGRYSVKVTDAASGCETLFEVSLSKGRQVISPLTIYPNPVMTGGETRIKYEFKKAASRNIVLRDIFGKVIWRSVIRDAKGELSISMANLRQGVYLLNTDGPEPVSKQLMVNEY